MKRFLIPCPSLCALATSFANVGATQGAADGTVTGTLQSQPGLWRLTCEHGSSTDDEKARAVTGARIGACGHTPVMGRRAPKR